MFDTMSDMIPLSYTFFSELPASAAPLSLYSGTSLSGYCFLSSTAQIVTAAGKRLSVQNITLMTVV